MVTKIVFIYMKKEEQNKFFFLFILTSVYKYTYNIDVGDDNMEINNPKYKNQGIHVVSAIFTVDKGTTKVLIIKRKNEPFKDCWSLVSGALYNDEEVLIGMKREIKEKAGFDNLHLELFDIFSDVNRAPVMRMVAIAYLGIVDKEKYNILKETLKTSDADWVPIDLVPTLAYDHNEILKQAYEKLKIRIKETDLLSHLYPNGFTMPEIQKIYESVLNKEFDRRNFRKKLLSTGLIEETNRTEKFDGNKPAKIYVFKDVNDIKNVF